MKQRRGEYPKLVKRPNGYYYIYFSRAYGQTLKTRDLKEAISLFNAKKAEIRENKIIEIGKISRIKLSEFKEEYISGSDNIPNRKLHCMPGTIDNDKLAINKFIEICGDLPLRHIQRKHVEDFKAKCIQLDLSMTYINILLRSLRAAFNTALAAGYISENSFIRKKNQTPVLFRLDDNIPRYYSINEIQAFFNAIDDNPEFKFAMEICLYHGLRRAELKRLQAQEIDFDNRFITVFGKGRKQRRIPIPVEYMETFREKLKVQIGRLFRWNEDTISRLFRKYADRVGMKGRLHDLRHSYATYLRMAGADLEYIQKLLGHEDLKTTQIYAKVVDSALQETADKLKFRLSGGNQN